MKITEISASVTRELDLGFHEYMKYLEEISPRNPPYGAKEDRKLKLFLHGKAQLEEGDDPREAMDLLVQTVDDRLLAFIAKLHPETIPDHAEELTYREVETTFQETDDEF